MKGKWYEAHVRLKENVLEVLTKGSSWMPRRQRYTAFALILD